MRTKTVFRRVSALCIPLFAFAAWGFCNTPKDPRRHVMAELEDASHRISVTALPSHAERLLLEIADVNGRKGRSTLLPSEVTSIDSLVVTGDRVMALGKLQRSAGDVIVVANLETGAVEKTLWCHDPAVSPSRQRVAFAEFTPRSAAGPGRGTLLSVADLAVPGIPVFEVYPDTAELTGRNGPGDEMRSHSLASPILWRDDRSLYFFDKFGATGSWQDYEIYLVRVEVSQDIGNSKYTRRALAPLVYAKAGTEAGAVHFLVQGLRWEAPGILEAVLYPQSYWQQPTVTIRVDDLLAD